MVGHVEGYMAKPLDLPFTLEAAFQVLQWGARPKTSPYSHKQIALWCDRFWCQYLESDAPPQIKKLLPILADVDTQWELYLINTYSLEELRNKDFEDVTLPLDWFEGWLEQAQRA